jgi:endonuclease/exonuclease/phosphatase family metal-dependent hydrolase
MSVENGLTELDRYLDKPIWTASEFIFSDGIVNKVIGIAMGVFGVPLALASRAIRWATHRYYQNEFLSYESQATKMEGTPKKFMTFNVCMMPGILANLFGSMSPAGQRLDRLAEFIKLQNADVVCLQEMTNDPSAQLIEKIKDTYKYFYYRIGPTSLVMENAMFWASKYPLENKPTYVPFAAGGIGFRRGFFVAELNDRFVISTHLEPGEENGKVRAMQIEQILKYKETLTKPIMLIGDLNVEPQDTRAIELLAKHFPNFKRADVERPTAENATCLDNISKVVGGKADPVFTVIDHILMTDQKIQQTVFPAFVMGKLSNALSDHQAVVLEIKLVSKL